MIMLCNMYENNLEYILYHTHDMLLNLSDYRLYNYKVENVFPYLAYNLVRSITISLKNK